MASTGRPPTRPRRPPVDLPAVHGRPAASITVTLDRPRPGDERLSNLYCRAPGQPPSDAADTPKRRGARTPRGEAADAVKKNGYQTWPVVTQPVSSASVTDGRRFRTDSDLLKPTGGPAGDSIVCAECGRCRCVACRSRRPLPQRLLCGRTCLLSAGNLVDCLSCLCCVKAVAYHCWPAGDSSRRSVDRPCGCRPIGSSCCSRWSLLALATPLLPCLLCYWPLRGVAKLAENCYQRGRESGCTCPSADGSDAPPPPPPLPRRIPRSTRARVKTEPEDTPRMDQR